MKGISRNSIFSYFTVLSALTTFCFGQANDSSIAKQQTQWCDGNAGMCFAMNIPSDVATDYYISMTAPPNVGWAAVGIGSQMSGSLMFIIAKNGDNITMSVRLADGYNQPTPVKNVSASLVEGTGFNTSFITANIHVTNGMFWSGGNLDKTNTAQNFIYAFSPRSVSGGATGDLAQHVVVGTFQLDMTAAIGAGGVPVVVSPATSWGWSTTILAHAVMMGIVWVGALPAGAVIIRFLDGKFKNPAFVHQYLQLSSFGIVFIAFFIGVGASKGQQFKFGHQWIGLILFLGLMIQGGLGWYHHKRYVEDKPTNRRWFTHLHLWFGRVLLFLGLINIGLGMQLYGDNAGAQAGWYLITIAIVSTYAFFYWHNFYRNKKRINDSFDPTPFEDPLDDDAASTKNYRPVNPSAAMSDNDLGTYKSEQYDPDTSGVNEYGARIKNTKAPAPSMTAIHRPATIAAPAATAGRRYDIVPTPLIPGPYGPTEPLRTGGTVHIDPQVDPFLDPPRPKTGGPRPQTGRPKTGVPYTVAMVGNEEAPVQTSPAVYTNTGYTAPAYTPSYGNMGYQATQNTGYATTQNTGYPTTQNTDYHTTQNTGYATTQNTGYTAQNTAYTAAPNAGYTTTHNPGYATAPNTGYGTAPSTPTYSAQAYDPNQYRT